MVWIAMLAMAVSFALAALATPASRYVALRLGLLDRPGHRKAHDRPVPLLGGSAVFVAIVLPSLGALAIASDWASGQVPSWLPDDVKVHVPGAAARALQGLGILLAAAVLHAVGIVDDRRALGPWTKLGAQVLVAAWVSLACDVRILTALGPALSVSATILWLVAITNAFNFLDNMDGLATGVAAICCAGLLAAASSLGQLFVGAWLCVILGALLGFLPHNLPPAGQFLGDGGSLVIGFLLGTVSCLTTYVPAGQTYYAYGVFVPLVLLAVPLYDTVSVVSIRLREGRNPMVGDRRHFSHRLVKRGMGVRTALLTIYLCTGCTAIGATLLARVDDPLAATLIFVQTVAIVMIIALLESTGPKRT
jgi:UDP-GlcNAc:undecaprenyl-phosphate GlcNAc-1-phosphate transferase